MRKLRLTAAILLSLLVAMLCVGCVESVSVTQFVDGGGSLHRSIVVSYDAKAVDAEDNRQVIKDVMLRYVDSHELADFATVSDANEGKVSLDLLFSSLDDYYLWLGYTGREENERETPSKTGIVNAYDREIESYLTEKNIEEVRALLDEQYRDFPLTAKFYYTYGTTNRSTISNGTRSEKGGIYYHTWEIDPDQPNKMMIRLYGLNVTAIYLIAISIFVLSLAVIFVIIYLIKRKERIHAALPHVSSRLSEGVMQTGREGDEASAEGNGEAESEEGEE